MISGLIWEVLKPLSIQRFWKQYMTRVQFPNYFLEILYHSNFFNNVCSQKLKLLSMHDENLLQLNLTLMPYSNAVISVSQNIKSFKTHCIDANFTWCWFSDKKNYGNKVVIIAWNCDKLEN